jgi:ribonuclease-3
MKAEPSEKGRGRTYRKHGLTKERIRRLNALQKKLGVSFRKPALLDQALTHRSYVFENGQDRTLSNERMEFLGDAILGLITSEFLYRTFSKGGEGSLTQARSYIVRGPILAERARKLGVGSYVKMSQSEKASGGADRESILSDCLEAIVGAVYLDRGLRGARDLVERLLLSDAATIIGDEKLRNYKSILQEYLQGQFGIRPGYRVVATKGPDHKKEFAVEVVMKGDVLGVGQGGTKKQAEQVAAKNALQKLKIV